MGDGKSVDLAEVVRPPTESSIRLSVQKKKAATCVAALMLVNSLINLKPIYQNLSVCVI
jgi:hypothetical protein